MSKGFWIACLLSLCFVSQGQAALFCPACGYRNELDKVEKQEVNAKGLTVTKVTHVRPPTCKNMNCKADLAKVPNTKRPPLEIFGKTQFWGYSSYSLDEGGSSDLGVSWQDMGLSEYMLHPERKWKTYWEVAIHDFGDDAFAGGGEATDLAVNYGRVMYFADKSKLGGTSSVTGEPRPAKVQTAYFLAHMGLHYYDLMQYFGGLGLGVTDNGFTYGYGIGVGYIFKTVKLEYRKTWWDADFQGNDVEMGGGRFTISFRF